MADVSLYGCRPASGTGSEASAELIEDLQNENLRLNAEINRLQAELKVSSSPANWKLIAYNICLESLKSSCLPGNWIQCMMVGSISLQHPGA